MVSIDFLSAAMVTIKLFVKKLTTVLSPSSSNEIQRANRASLDLKWALLSCPTLTE